GFSEDLLVVDLDIEDVFRTRLHDPRRRKERHQAKEAGGAPIFVSAAPRRTSRHSGNDATAPASPDGALGPTARSEQLVSPVEEAYQALVLGVGDYVRKNGFRDAVIALSGGIDSALTATIAVDALGKEHVWGVLMPSPYSSQGSRDDAHALAEHLVIRALHLPITDCFVVMLCTL